MALLLTPAAAAAAAASYYHIMHYTTVRADDDDDDDDDDGRTARRLQGGLVSALLLGCVGVERACLTPYCCVRALCMQPVVISTTLMATTLMATARTLPHRPATAGRLTTTAKRLRHGCGGCSIAHAVCRAVAAVGSTTYMCHQCDSFGVVSLDK